MTLQEKFKQWLDTDPRLQIREVQLEVIADEFAIGFAEWLDCKYYQGDDFNEYYRSIDEYRDGKHFTATQLLEIYKKDKGL